MAIPREALQRAVDAGHADSALIGLPVSLVREILQKLPAEFIAHCSASPAAQGAPA